MDKQQDGARVKSWMKILLWLGLLVFFAYSFQAIMDLDDLTSSKRQEGLLRLLKALAHPEIFEYEYDTRETMIDLHTVCKDPDDNSKNVQIDERTIIFDLKICDSIHFSQSEVNGSGFQPNIEGSIAWVLEDSFIERRTIAKFETDEDGNFTTSIYPDLRRNSNLVIIEELRKTNLGFSRDSNETVKKMWETIQMGFLATTLGAVIALPFTFFSARPSSLWSRGINLLLQPILSAVRAVHPIILTVPALIYVGIGPTAGVLALTLYSSAVLIITFSDYAREQSCLSWPALFAIYFPGLALKRLPVNTMIATVLGFVGGGGIGFLLNQNIKILDYRSAGVQILACIIGIGSMDLICRAVWHKIQRDRVPLRSTPENAGLQ